MNKQNKYNHSFQVPKDYFESLENRVMKNRNQTNHGFTVPDGYFDQLENTVVNNLKISLKDLKNDDRETALKLIYHNTETKKSNKLKWLLPLVAAAAIFIGIITFNGLQTETANMEQVSLSQLDDQEIMDYLVIQPMMEQTETYEYLYADTKLPENTGITADIQDDEILDYLMDNISDQTLLEE